jgi:hypothetical protein
MKSTKKSITSTKKVYTEKDLASFQLSKYSDTMSICMHCKNAVGNCSWSENFRPVNGWNAVPSCYIDDDITVKSYKVISCPLYQPDRPSKYGYEISTSTIAKLCGMSLRTAQRATEQRLNKILQKLGLKVVWYREPTEEIGSYYISLIK